MVGVQYHLRAPVHAPVNQPPAAPTTVGTAALQLLKEFKGMSFKHVRHFLDEYEMSMSAGKIPKSQWTELLVLALPVANYDIFNTRFFILRTDSILSWIWGGQI